MTKQKNEPQSYEITWVDIQSDEDAWVSEEDIKEHDVALCKDICYIYSDKNNKLITYTSYSVDSDGSVSYGGVCAFPKGCIKRIRKL